MKEETKQIVNDFINDAGKILDDAFYSELRGEIYEEFKWMRKYLYKKFDYSNLVEAIKDFIERREYERR